MKKKNKISIIVLSILLITIVLAGCGPVFYSKKTADSIETSYYNWAKEVLFACSGPQVTSYNENGNIIQISFSTIHKDKKKGYQEMADLISRHNLFVASNPDYFPAETDIHLIVDQANQFPEIVFSSHYGDKEDEDLLGNDYDASIKYAIAYVVSLNSNPLENGIEITTDNLVLNFDASPKSAGNIEYYKVMNNFKNTRNIIVNSDSHENSYLDEDSCRDNILQFEPNANVFYSWFMHGLTQ